MPHEYSVGIIVYSGDEFLLLRYAAGHWGFVKGKPYTGEKRLDAARRETKEETGITQLYISKDFIQNEEYFFKRTGATVHKEVDYFLAETPSKDIKLSIEHEEYKWLKFEEAMAQLTYSESKNILKEAHDYIKRHG